jgi:acyl-CoA thioesterase
MEFQQVLAPLNQASCESCYFDIPEDWGQGRALFGGMAAAIAFSYLQALLGDAAKVRSLSVSFIAPIAPGPVQLKREILRIGKSVQHAEVRIYQQEQLALVLLASFGAARTSVVEHQPELIDISAPVMAQLPKQGPVPEFTQHFDYQLTSGGFPFSGTAAVQMSGRNRFSQQSTQSPCSVAELIALIDAWPPATLSWLQAPAPASSLTWSLEFLTTDFAFTANDWWYYRAQIDAAHEGYSHIEARFIDAAGKLVAISRQTVTVFA